MRKEPKISSIPVVAFSNYDGPETKKQAAKLGVKDYLIKTSYTPQEIVEKIKEYLKEWSMSFAHFHLRLNKLRLGK